MQRFAIVAAALAVLFVIPTAQAKEPQDASPSECYTSYNLALPKANDLKDLAPYLCKPRRAAWRSLSPEQQVQELQKCKAWYAESLKVLQEKISNKNKKAHLVLGGRAKRHGHFYDATIIIDMVREDHYWKISGGDLKGPIGL